MGILALVGGNEFREDCQRMDQRLLALLPAHPRLVILPTAAVRGSPRMAAEHGVRHFTTLGAAATAAMIITREEANDPHRIAPLHEADGLYFAGGDPTYLLDVVRDSLLWHALRAVLKRGGLVAGSSAGAMLLAGAMRTWNTGGWTAGLGFAPTVAVLVHHHYPDPTAAHGAPLPVVGIAEASACFTTDGETWEVAGSGGVSLYSPTGARHLAHGASFTLPATG
jgi:cyanophycinase